MIVINVPGFNRLKLKHLMLDFNGTLAIDGNLIEGTADLLQQLSKKLSIHVITADTFGTAAQQLAPVPCNLIVVSPENQAIAKLNYLKELNPDETVCIGNGRNDRFILREAVIGIALIQNEGAALESISEADIICKNIIDALLLFIHPKRFIATMRS